MKDLPEPDSNELKSLVRGAAERELYQILHANRDRFLTMRELRDLAGDRSTHEQLGRRKRNLHRYFIFEKRAGGREFRIVARKPDAPEGERGIDEKVRSAVLATQRCAMCGKVPLEDGVKLQVDHKIPREWGGTDDLDNLQPLCEQCNRGKKNLFASLSEHGDRIAKAVQLDDPHRRIAELLRAFEGDWVPSYLIGIVASAKQYQEDWQRRIRELREIGWDYEYLKRKEDDRFVTFYRLTKWGPWPRGGPKAAIKKREAARRSSKGPS